MTVADLRTLLAKVDPNAHVYLPPDHEYGGMSRVHGVKPDSEFEQDDYDKKCARSSDVKRPYVVLT
jgi:hypothetical protein